ncbi:5-methylcytosine-specific restriction endonuclease McrA [Pseudonocardia sediminis]|uniref:5-methylcytosine-specific restriction endonuclease McrA n=1 Tax=Pseudonocardia sediminis TaxID=1397368 RepID=A0A4Q7V431_PSEST|nr:5-methylcytosine-specific restriction endonuclease McrA [Pseudonocardia sediminis]
MACESCSPGQSWPKQARQARCGHLVPAPAGTPPLYCDNCDAQRLCVQCGSSIAGRRGNTKFCSLFCSQVHAGVRFAEPLPDRPCALGTCSLLFRPRRHTQLCCCEDHGKRFWHENAKTRGYVDPGLRVKRQCEACGQLVERRRQSLREGARVTCRSGPCRTLIFTGQWPSSAVPDGHPIRSTPVPVTHESRRRHRVRFVDSECRECGDRFLWDRTIQGADTWYCSRRCSRRAGNGRRRLRKHRSECEPIWRRRIYKRDQYRCHLCRRKVAIDKAVPHPRAPTLDHVIPLARGGSHTMANLRTACFSCNCLKSDRGGGEQLSLIG